MLAALIRKELLALLRDPHALAALFLMPAAFIVVMSLALKNMYAPPLETLAYALDAREQSPIARRFAADWQKTHGTARPLHADWPEALRQGRLSYVLTLERGMAEALAALAPATAPVVRLRTEPGLDRGAFRALQAEMAGAVGELRAAALQAQLTGDSPRGSQSILPFLAFEQNGGARQQPTAVQQNVPAWLVFGMFFVVTAISSLFVQEQQGGTLARLAAMGVPDASQILSKALPYVAVNAIQAVLMLAVGTLLMPLLGTDGLSLSGIHWPALILVLLAISLAAIGFALLLACLARTHAQANTLGPMCNILMAALGGIMVPTFVMPPLMQQLARLSPMNWGLEGLLTVLLRHGDTAEAAPWALRLGVFGLVALFTASRLFPRRIKP
jgi:ABC-2 type transport system permease protein